MRCIAFEFLGQHRHGTAFHQYLKLRKRFFVDTLRWAVPHDGEVEMDQYDNPCAHYVFVMQDSTVLAGARVMPTTARWGKHSYMLRDALQGNIDIPAGAVAEEIVTDEVWECTRLIISDVIETRSGRSACLSMLLGAAGDLVASEGGYELISLSPLPLLRTLRQLGFPARRVGEPYRESDGRSYAMLRMPVTRPAHSVAAE